MQKSVFLVSQFGGPLLGLEPKIGSMSYRACVEKNIEIVDCKVATVLVAWRTQRRALYCESTWRSCEELVHPFRRHHVGPRSQVLLAISCVAEDLPIVRPVAAPRACKGLCVTRMVYI